jgi:phosphoribosylformimino-5-aminoimidazole carboxamide ribotide isomerase
MIIYPAIDIKSGKCVRLSQGEFDKETVFSNNPIQIANQWMKMGAKFLHLVDLDGAKVGDTVNKDIIIEIAHKINIPIQVGGGIRDIETIEKYLNNGVNRVILGTAALNNRNFLKQAIETYEKRIVVGIDAKNGKVAINGWINKSNIDAVSFAKEVEQMGAHTIIYTDISKDGMLEGPNLDAMKEMVGSISIDVIASGGVCSLEDIRELKKTGVKGVIVGKALYTGYLDLEEALLC